MVKKKRVPAKISYEVDRDVFLDTYKDLYVLYSKNGACEENGVLVVFASLHIAHAICSAIKAGCWPMLFVNFIKDTNQDIGSIKKVWLFKSIHQKIAVNFSR